MNSDKLFKTLKGSYHDGALIDAIYRDNTLYMYCFRNPPIFDNQDDIHPRYIIIRFDNVENLEVYDWKKTDKYLPYNKNSFCKKNGLVVISGINRLDLVDDLIVFEECVRFNATDLEVLASSDNELEFHKYVRI